MRQWSGSQRVRAVISFTAVCLVLTSLMWPILASPNDLYPSGIDALGHLSKVEQVAINWRQGEFSDWYPRWYNGSAAVQYYPPLSVWIPALFQLVIGDVRITFKVLCWVCMVFGGWSAVALARRLGQGWFGATVSGVFYCGAAYTLHTVFWWGTLGRALSLPVFPFLLGSWVDILEKTDAKRFLKTVLLVLLQMLIHVMHAYFLFVCTGVIALIWSFRFRDWWRRLVSLMGAVVLGVLMSAFWSIPGYVPWDIHGVPAAGPGGSVIHSMAYKYLVLPSSPGGHICVLLFAVLGTIWLMKRRSINLALALSLGTLIPLSFICGPASPLYRFLPLAEALQPQRFLNAAYLPAALLCGFSLESVRGRQTGLVIMSALAIGLCTTETWLRRPYQPYTSYDELTLLLDAADIDGESFDVGRIATELPGVNSEKAYFTAAYDLNSIDGWNFEGSPHVYSFRNQNHCLGSGFEEYVVSNWSLWNVRYALVDQRAPRLFDLLKQDGWVQKAANDWAVLFQSQAPSSYLQKMDSQVLAIGRSGFFIRRLMPGVSEGRNPNPLEYPEEYIDLFRAIYLYDLPPIDPGALEARIIQWLRKGKQVILDLSSSMEIGSLFGVRVTQVPVPSKFELVPIDGGPFTTPIDITADSGSGAVYKGLDEEWLTLSTESGRVSVCGARELQCGTVVFTGLHIPRLVTVSAKGSAVQMLEIILAPFGSSPFQTSSLPLKRIEWSGHGVKFEYDLDRSVHAVLSLTYTQRWHAYIDGHSTRVLPHQDLILLSLPEGEHVVELCYGDSPALRFGWGITAFGSVATALEAVRLSVIARRRRAEGEAVR